MKQIIPPSVLNKKKEIKKPVKPKKLNWELIMIGLLVIIGLSLVVFGLWQSWLKIEAGNKISGLLNQNPQVEGHFPTIKPTNPPEPITLIFTGDVIPARSVNSQMTKRNNFQYPFEKTAAFLKEADLTIINLEAPLVKNCPVSEEGMVFCGSERFIEGLQFAGVDVVTLANNHSSNYGQEGIDNTVRLLKENNIKTTGIGDIAYQEVKGRKFAFIGFNGVSPLVEYLATIDKETIKKLVSEAKTNADFVIVLFHWSQEYSPLPKKDTVAPFDPVEIAHFTVDCGADLVIGNHPHTVLGYENYQNKLIFYALGNFIFDQMWSYETRVGAVLKISLNSGVNSFSLSPVIIDNYAQPRFLEGEEKQTVLDRMKKMIY